MSAREYKDLNFKVPPEWHRAIKVIAGLLGVPMKDLALLSIDCWVKGCSSPRLQIYLPETKPWKPKSVERFKRPLSAEKK